MALAAQCELRGHFFLLAAVQARTWPEAAERLQRLEALYARTPLFRRPR